MRMPTRTRAWSNRTSQVVFSAVTRAVCSASDSVVPVLGRSLCDLGASTHMSARPQACMLFTPRPRQLW